MPLLASYGCIHDKAKADEFLGVSDSGTDTFFIVFDGPLYGSNALVDLEISGHTYSILCVPANTRTKFYWTLGASKDNTQVDFVDRKPVAEATEAWPKITSSPLEISLSVSTYVGDAETYPTRTSPVYGVDWKPVTGLSLSVDDKGESPIQIPKEDTSMAFHKTSTVYPAERNILESEVGLVLKTHQAKQSDAKLDETTGRKILAAGSLYTDETTKETGVVFEDYDLTDYEVFPISVVMQGRLLYDRCSEEAQAKIEDFKGQGLQLIGKVDD